MLKFRQTQELVRLVQSELGSVNDDLARYRMTQRAGNTMHGDVVVADKIARLEARVAELEELTRELTQM